MQTTKMRLHRRDFLKASTAASTAAAFGAFALAGNGAAIAATQATDKSGSMMVAQASMTEGDIAALPRFKLDLVAPPFVPSCRPAFRSKTRSGRIRRAEGGRSHNDR